jgi:histidine ammonia-lyase
MSISERRIESMVNPDLSYGLPAFLARTPGLQSGMMIAQVAAASLLNEAKVLAHPASTDSIPTSAGKEDHVSMGMTSALKLRSIAENAESLLAIELLVAAEALEHRRPLKSSASVERGYGIVRNYAGPLVNDRSLAREIEQIAFGIRAGEFDSGHEKL